MATYAEKTGLAKTADGSESWGAENRSNMDFISNFLTPDRVFFVSPEYTPENLGNGAATNRRHFPTIQEAIDVAQVGTSYSSPNLIKIEPGTYSENLVISGSVALIGQGSVPHHGAQYWPIKIFGSTSVQSPVITINEPDNVTIAVNFRSILVRPSYNQTASTINKAMILQFNTSKPNYGPWAPWVSFKDCDIFGQPAGLNNAWQSAFAYDGWCRILMHRCNILTNSYAAGGYNGGAQYMFNLLGDYASAGKVSQLQLRECGVHHDFGGTLTPATILAQDGVSGLVVGSHFTYTDAQVKTYLEASNGGKYISGVRASDIDNPNYANTFGVNWQI